MNIIRSAMILVCSTLIAGCSASATPSGPPPVLTPSRSMTPTVRDGASGAPIGDPSPVGVVLAAWRVAPLTDVRSGETFSIADLTGKLVVIEPMAIWCTNCAHQQREAAKALTSLASADVVYISLDVDPSERDADLAAYAEGHDFDWRFVVAGREVSRALAEAFGDQVLSPPSTPRIMVTPSGEVIGPSFGIEDASAVEATLRDQLS